MAIAVILIWVLHFSISFWNAHAVGQAWVEAKHYGGWPRFMVWMGAIMSASGFTWCYLIMLGYTAYALNLLTVNDLAQMFTLGYILLIPGILFAGLMITVDSWALAYRTQTESSIGVALWNTCALIHDTTYAIYNSRKAMLTTRSADAAVVAADAFADIAKYLSRGAPSNGDLSSGDPGSKSSKPDQGNSKGAASNLVRVLVCVLLAMAVLAGVATTAVIIIRIAGSHKLPEHLSSASAPEGQQKILAARKHSRLGIASFIASLLPCTVLFVSRLFGISDEMFSAGFFGGTLLGLGLGIGGLLQRQRKKAFAIVGISLSALTVIGIVLLWNAIAYFDDNLAPPVPHGSFADPPGTVINSIGMKLVPIAAGEFLMGSPNDCPLGHPKDEFQHRVQITKPYLLGMHEVTQSQYERVTGANPSYFRGADLPVEHLTWQDAQGFCEILSSLPDERAAGRRYRMPTEAEWEYACRAGTMTPFNVGEELGPRLARFALLPRWSPKLTARAGTYPPNAWGLFEMHGNVWEWTNDWYSEDYFQGSPIEDPQGPHSGTHHVLRGGSASVTSRECSSTIRGEAKLDKPNANSPVVNGLYARLGDFGIRVVCVYSSPAADAESGATSGNVEKSTNSQ